MKQITLQITTRNRLDDIKISLLKNQSFLNDQRVHTIVCVDGSNDETYNFIKINFPDIELIQNNQSIGYIASRNRLMMITKTPFAVSLDDDAHFLSENNVDSILQYFSDHLECAVIAFRIYWSKDLIQFLTDNENPCRVRGFVGCGHAWRMAYWKEIRPYPEWFIFYGEEEYAGYELFKHNREIHYFPEIFIQHRVNLSERKRQKGNFSRNRRSLSSGWYLWLLFIPKNLLLKYFAGSILNQINKIVKGNLITIWVLFVSVYDLILNLNKIYSFKKRLNQDEYKRYLQLHNTKIYWKIENHFI